jgi:DNA-binding NarL/FixJ family response regulator
MSDPRLTAREVQVIRAVARHGGAGRMAAAELGISPQTVKNHLSSVYGKLGAVGLTDALARMGWLRVPE